MGCTVCSITLKLLIMTVLNPKVWQNYVARLGDWLFKKEKLHSVSSLLATTDIAIERPKRFAIKQTAPARRARTADRFKQASAFAQTQMADPQAQAIFMAYAKRYHCSDAHTAAMLFYLRGRV